MFCGIPDKLIEANDKIGFYFFKLKCAVKHKCYTI